MELQRLEPDFTVCKIKHVEQVDLTREFTFLSKTDEEISLVCPTAHVPAGLIASEPNWRALKISGVLDFSLVGIIANIGAILTQAGISIFVISTYNTDYIFIKTQTFDRAVCALAEKGYVIK